MVKTWWTPPASRFWSCGCQRLSPGGWPNLWRYQSRWASHCLARVTTRLPMSRMYWNVGMGLMLETELVLFQREFRQNFGTLRPDEHILSPQNGNDWGLGMTWITWKILEFSLSSEILWAVFQVRKLPFFFHVSMFLRFELQIAMDNLSIAKILNLSVSTVSSSSYCVPAGVS